MIKMEGRERLYKVFIADCKREMSLRNWKNGDLAKATGYSCDSINRFFSEDRNRNKSEKVAQAISVALNVPIV